MTLQRLLLRVLGSRAFGRTGAKILRRVRWTIEQGEAAGMKLSLPQNIDFIRGTSELPVQQTLAKHLRLGAVAYDIGANMGFFSLIASRLVGPTGAVYSFEPVAENGAAMARNFSLNSLENVELFELAVGEQSGFAELFLTEWDGGSTLASSAVKASEPLSRRTVRVVSLDDLIDAQQLRPPDLVKIDVEGVELAVLQGMRKTIATAKPALLYEVDDGNRASFDQRWKEIDTYVADLGYTITHLEPSYPDIDWHVGHTLALPDTTFSRN